MVWQGMIWYGKVMHGVSVVQYGMVLWYSVVVLHGML